MLMSKIQPKVTRWKSTIRKGKTYDVFCIQRENDNSYTKILGKSDISKEKKKGRRQQLLGTVTA